jgi:uncharacterized membrane protein YeiH
MIVNIIVVLNIMGVIVFAFSGALKGLKHQLDLLGVVVLGIITALGGGIIRDVIMTVRPDVFINERDIYFAIGASLVTFIFGRKIKDYIKIIKIFDAAGLAVFTVIGAEKSLANHFGMMGIIMMGTLTGVAGGMIRDLLVLEIPLILKKEIYALFCITGSFLYWFLIKITGLDQNLAIIIVITFIFAGRIFAIYFNLQLPRKKIS